MMAGEQICLKRFFCYTSSFSFFFHGTICSSTEYLWSIGKQTFTTWVRYFSFKNHVNCSWKKQCSKIVAGIRLLKDVLKWYIILQTRHLFLSTIRKYQGNAKFTKEISNLHCYLCNVHLTTYVLSEKCSGFKIGEIVLWWWYISIIYTWTLGRFMNKSTRKNNSTIKHIFRYKICFMVEQRGLVEIEFFRWG